MKTQKTSIIYTDKKGTHIATITKKAKNIDTQIDESMIKTTIENETKTKIQIISIMSIQTQQENE